MPAETVDPFVQYILIIISVVFVNNFVLAKFLGLCPFVGVSKKTHAALGMGMAVCFVMTLASIATWVIHHFVFREDTVLRAILGPNISGQELQYVLKTISYILVIAALVQLVEIFMKKVFPALYQTLGIYLPLITTNCAILGVALLNTTDAPDDFIAMGIMAPIVQGLFAGVGFTIALLLMSGIRERLDVSLLPKAFQGVPVAFICTGLMALAFLGFTGIIEGLRVTFSG
jgi:Na+-translocating ferredoxin:NAD+ oxidoreductase subunit A